MPLLKTFPKTNASFSLLFLLHLPRRLKTWYISERKSHLISWFYGIELGLKSTL